MINTFDELIRKIESDGKNSHCLRFYHNKYIQAQRELDGLPINHTRNQFDYAIMWKNMFLNTLDGIIEGLVMVEIIDEDEAYKVRKDLFGEEG